MMKKHSSPTTKLHYFKLDLDLVDVGFATYTLIKGTKKNHDVILTSEELREYNTASKVYWEWQEMFNDTTRLQKGEV